ncbi:MAG: ABC transporter ATP-binding protein [Rhodomicrobium sp.]
MPDPMLEAENVSVRREGRILALRNLKFQIPANCTLGVLGANGAGKSTLLDTISGFLRPESGTIRFLGERISGRPAHEITRMGLVQVSQARDLFTNLSVSDNLKLGAFVRGSAEAKRNFDRVFEYFPRLAERQKQTASTLSGGEQQMLAIARALMTEPKLLLLDEPSAGLSPKLVQEIENMLARLKASGLSMILVEQNLTLAAKVVDRFLLMQSGEIVAQGNVQELSQKAAALLEAHYI